MTYADWDYWELYSPVTIDGEAKLIFINEDVSNLTVKGDIYSAWKRWTRLYDYAKFLPAFRTIGGDPVGGGLYAGDIYFLINGWQIVVDHPVQAAGILYHDDPLSPWIIMPGGGIVSTVSNLAYAYDTTGGSSPADIWGYPARTLTSGIPTPEQVAASVWASVTRTLTDQVLDWTEAEKQQIRHRMGIDGVSLAPAAVPSLASATEVAAVKADTATLLTNSSTSSSDLAAVKADTEAILADNQLALDLLQTLIKYQANRTKIDQFAKTLTVYDDDGVTPIRVFDLKNFTGQPSLTEVAERDPL